MKFTACILKPRGPFHIGEREGMREGSEVFIHSDTLFSALCHSYLLLYGRAELDALLTMENGTDPPIVFSSAFPYWKEDYYFPIPRNYQARDKSAKKLKFIPKSVFERLLAGIEVPDIAAWGIPREDARPWHTEDVPRVTLSRSGNRPLEEGEGGFYHIGITSYVDDAALFFLVRFGSDAWRAKLTAAIRLMCDEGIGGYRTVGKGQFEQPDFSDVSIEQPESANARLLLSLYYPVVETETPGLSDGWYDLLSRSGYVYSPNCQSLRRKTVLMFAEGSVFPGGERRGRVVDVTPDKAEVLGLRHRVLRNGLAFGVPCQLEAGRST